MALTFLLAVVLLYLPYYAFNKAMDIQYKLYKMVDYSIEEFEKDKLYGAMSVVIIFAVIIFIFILK